MIVRIRHKGLVMLWEDDNPRGLNARHIGRIARILDNLDDASKVDELNLPGYRLHKLTGSLAGYWSITVNANWRIIFRFESTNATDIDLLDYH
jgi:proteic killer suppression protein